MRQYVSGTLHVQRLIINGNIVRPNIWVLPWCKNL